jgi:hypothetical protein
MRCSSCGEDEVFSFQTTCPDPEEPSEFRTFGVCRNCDYGINEHTEGECNCAGIHVTVDPNHPRKVKIIIDGPTCSTFNAFSRDEARVLAALITLYLDRTEA